MHVIGLENQFSVFLRVAVLHRFYYILVLIAYAQRPPLNAHAGVSSGSRGLTVGVSLHLHPYFMYASSEGSGQSAQTHQSLRCSTNCYVQNLMCWLKYVLASTEMHHLDTK